MADGITNTQRVDGTTERMLHSKVVDNIHNSPTYMSRLMSMAQPFTGKSQDFTLDVENSTQFEWFTGLETLNSSAEDTTITLSYEHTAGTQPVVSIMAESFANAGTGQTINLDAFNHQKAAQEAIRQVATVAYSGTASGDQPLGLQSIVDDGTNKSTIGGQSRATYSALDATYTDSGGTLTLAKLGTLDDAAATGSELSTTPNINVVDFTRWSLYEQLLDPQVRANYNSEGAKRVPITGSDSVSASELMGAAGFISLHHRGRPVIKDKFATSGVWYKLNEETFGWYGRNAVPDKYRGKVEKVTLGDMSEYESRARENAPTGFSGWFFQKEQILPNQAGMISRFYVFGNMLGWEFRLNGQLHSITGV